MMPDPARYAHARDPETSQEASRAIEASRKRSQLQLAILAVMRAHPGCTAGEYADLLGDDMRLQDVRRRLSELHAAVLVQQCRARACTSSHSGGSIRRCVTWRVPGPDAGEQKRFDFSLDSPR